MALHWSPKPKIEVRFLVPVPNYVLVDQWIDRLSTKQKAGGSSPSKDAKIMMPS